MELYEYLMQELGLDKEQAEEIAAKVREYKEKYGRRHHHQGKEENRDVFSMTVESREGVLANKNDPDKIHCNGCENRCAISAPQCGRGRKIAEMLKAVAI